MRALITGGAGFIGSHLADALIGRGDEVEVIDDLSTGSIDNIEHLMGSGGFRFYRGTIMDEALMERLISRCDMIFHMAAAVGVRLIVEQPVKTLVTNILGTHTILNLASRYRKKVILASTSEIYGKSENLPFKEEDDRVLGPTTKSRWSYSCSKAVDEFLSLAYWKEKGLPVVILRFFNIIGPRQTGRYGMVVPRFVRQALAGEPITVYGDGKQSRNFTYIDEAVRCVIDLSQCPEAEGEVVNVGDSASITIEDLAMRIKRLAKSGSRIVYISYDEAYEKGFEDMRERVPDTSKLKRLIGFTPALSLDEMLTRVIEFHRRGMPPADPA